MYNYSFGNHHQNPAVKARTSQRFSDIAESERLLLEIATSEPTLQQCFKIIESTCLSQGIFCKIDDRPAKEEFLDHIEEYYTPFCKQALRAMHIYGFVPWRTKHIKDQDRVFVVPEVLPCGTFSWYTEVYGSRDKGNSKRQKIDNNFNNIVVYRLTPIAGAFKEEDVNIYIHTPATLDIMNNSILYATIQSPLAHLLTDYKALRQGQIRRSHADAWNTTAKIITQFDPKLRVEDNPSQYLMDFVHEDYFVPPNGGDSMYPPFEAHNVWQREHIIRRQFDTSTSAHHPEVFALPRDHTIAQQTRLDPCEDIMFLNDKYKRDVCSLLGVPYEMVQGKDGGGFSHENAKKTMASGRIFSTNMQELCKHCSRLLVLVYREIYGKSSSVSFTLVPMPRLEIEQIADLKILHEIGALSPDMCLKMSKTLLGDDSMFKKKNPNMAKNTSTSLGNDDDEEESLERGDKDDKKKHQDDKKSDL
jgi:hypothetical protein